MTYDPIKSSLTSSPYSYHVGQSHLGKSTVDIVDTVASSITLLATLVTVYLFCRIAKTNAAQVGRVIAMQNCADVFFD
jgi:hypothetical protein